MQNVLRNIHELVLDCDEDLHDSKQKTLDLKKHSRCYVRIYDVIKNGDVFFGLPAWSDVARTRILSLSLSFNMMKLLFLKMCQNLCIKSNLNPSVISKPFFEESMTMMEEYNAIGKSVNETRLNRIGPVSVCTRNTIFFKDFDDHCSPATELVDLGISGGSLTGSKEIFKHKYRITVIDEQLENSGSGSNRSRSPATVCEIELEAPNDSQLEKAKKKCNHARLKHIKKVEQKIQNFIDDRVNIVISSLSKLWGNSRTQLRSHFV